MKKILFGFLLCVSCGDSVEKKTGGNNGVVINNGTATNNGTTNGTNNGIVANNGDGNCKASEQKATVNGQTACFEKCSNGFCSGDAVCTQGICISGFANNGSSNNGSGEVCQSNADCRVDQECRETCLDHLECGDTSYNSPQYAWANCQDGKEYDGACEIDGNGNSCDCIVNGTLVKSFVTPTRPNRSEAHRIFNENCEWLVPSL